MQGTSSVDPKASSTLRCAHELGTSAHRKCLRPVQDLLDISRHLVVLCPTLLWSSDIMAPGTLLLRQKPVCGPALVVDTPSEFVDAGHPHVDTQCCRPVTLYPIEKA